MPKLKERKITTLMLNLTKLSDYQLKHLESFLKNKCKEEWNVRKSDYGSYLLLSCHNSKGQLLDFLKHHIDIPLEAITSYLEVQK